MLDIRLLRAEPEKVKAALAKRGEDVAVIDDLVAIDEERRRRQSEMESLKAEQNRLGPQIAQARRVGEDASALLERSTHLKAAIQTLDDTACLTSPRISTFARRISERTISWRFPRMSWKTSDTDRSSATEYLLLLGRLVARQGASEEEAERRRNP